MASFETGTYQRKRQFKTKVFRADTSARASAQAMKASLQRKLIQKQARLAALRALGRTNELKYFDTLAAYQQIDRAGTFFDLTPVPQGAGQGARIGDAVAQKFLRLSIDAYYNAAAISTDVGHKLRVIVFRWLVDTAGSVPAIGSILANATTVLVTACDYNWTDQKMKEFQILADDTYALNHATDLVYRRKIDLKNYKEQYQPTLTTGMGHVYCLLIADDATGAHTPDIQAQLYARFVYTDA